MQRFVIETFRLKWTNYNQKHVWKHQKKWQDKKGQKNGLTWQHQQVIEITVRFLKQTGKTKDSLKLKIDNSKDKEGQAVSQQHCLMTHGPGSLKSTKGTSKMSTWSPSNKNAGNMMVTPNLAFFVLCLTTDNPGWTSQTYTSSSLLQCGYGKEVWKTD